jgi:hypothetical protein
MTMKKIGSLVACTVVFLFALWASTGCSLFAKKEQGSPSSDTGLRVAFSDFEDVPIPSEVSPNKKKTQLYSAGKGKVGLLTLEGRVDPDSLAAFFQNNLPRNGWKPMTSLKDRDHVLVFVKDDRVCLINISEGWFTTVCEVRVGLLEKASEPGKGTPTR